MSWQPKLSPFLLCLGPCYASKPIICTLVHQCNLCTQSPPVTLVPASGTLHLCSFSLEGSPPDIRMDYSSPLTSFRSPPKHYLLDRGFFCVCVFLATLPKISIPPPPKFSTSIPNFIFFLLSSDLTGYVSILSLLKFLKFRSLCILALILFCF